MKNVLLIKSSISGEKGQSSILANAFLKHLAIAPEHITTVDLNTNALPHLDMSELGAWMADTAERSPEQQRLAEFSDNIISQFEDADIIVIGVPMYNFAIPSQLKSLLDRVARAGRTFKYTEQGPVGLLQDKPVVLLATRGGVYQGTAADSQTPYLTTYFNFIGLTQLHFVYAEGLNMGADTAEKALSAANKQLIALSHQLLA